MNKHTLDSHVRVAIDKSLGVYREIITYRDDLLFTHFLPEGYRYVTLTSVDNDFYDDVSVAKFHLGMLITVLDDFADHPRHVNSRLLHELYKIPFESQYIETKSLDDNEHAIVRLVEYISNQMTQNLQRLPHYLYLKDVFEFDLRRFYQANRFAELLTHHTELTNSDELQQLRPFNMGMVIAGMMDVMASSEFDLRELGAARRIFHLGQRFGSICNNINTFAREWAEGDVTNEITVKGFERQLIQQADIQCLSSDQVIQKLNTIFQELIAEQHQILQTLAGLNQAVQSFDCAHYADGLVQLKTLHESMEGVI